MEPVGGGQAGGAVNRRLSKVSLQSLLDTYEKGKSIDENGLVTFQGMFLMDAPETLESLIDFNPQVPPLERGSILRQALKAAGASGVLTEKSLCEELIRFEGAFLALPRHEFEFVSRISVDLEAACEFQATGGRIRLSREIAPAIADARLRVFSDNHESLRDPDKWGWLAMRVVARTYTEAAELGFRQVRALIGGWNHLLLLRRRQLFSRGSRTSPDIRLGPLQTIHNADGSAAANDYWFDQSWQGAGAGWAPKFIGRYQTWDGAINGIQILLSKVEELDQKFGIAEILGSYQAALEDVDSNSGTLKMWGVLEAITNSANLDHTKTVARAIAIFGDRESGRLFLDPVRQLRNSFAHRGQESHLAGAMLERARIVVDAHLELLFADGGRFANHDEYGQMLSLPPDPETLRRQVELRRVALELLHAPPPEPRPPDRES